MVVDRCASSPGRRWMVDVWWSEGALTTAGRCRCWPKRDAETGCWTTEIPREGALQLLHAFPASAGDETLADLPYLAAFQNGGTGRGEHGRYCHVLRPRAISPRRSKFHQHSLAAETGAISHVVPEGTIASIMSIDHDLSRHLHRLQHVTKCRWQTTTGASMTRWASVHSARY